MKTILNCLGCALFMLGTCTPNDSVIITSTLLAAGSLIVFRQDILSWIWKRSSYFQRFFPSRHTHLFISSESRKGGQ